METLDKVYLLEGITLLCMNQSGVSKFFDYFSEKIATDYGISDWDRYKYVDGTGNINMEYLSIEPPILKTKYYFVPKVSDNFHLELFKAIAADFKNEYPNVSRGFEITSSHSRNYESYIILGGYKEFKNVSETYEYNIQGWLTSKQSDLFDMELKYYDPDELTLPGTGGRTLVPSYTGNITQWTWQQKDHADSGLPQNSYGFTYDALIRLTDSRLFKRSGMAWTASDSFTETIGSLEDSFALPAIEAYDLNGNINYLRRTGADGDMINEFRYFYTGNRLTRLTVIDPNNPGNRNYGVDFRYDKNGNMIYNGYKDLVFKYSSLNLVDNVSVPETETKADYTWSSDGKKLQVIDNDGNGYLYLGSLVYRKQNGSEWELESTGFVRWTDYCFTGWGGDWQFRQRDCLHSLLSSYRPPWQYACRVYIQRRFVRIYGA